jgi:cysteine-rich repeat protein
MRRLAVLVGMLVGLGCYSPTYLVGLMCSTENTCPPGQGCNPEHKCMPTAAFDAGRGSGGSNVGAGGGSAGGGGAAGAGNRGGAGPDGGATDRLSTVDAGPLCGNKVIEAGEECDDGNATAGDGCSATCQIEGLVDHWALGTQFMNGDNVPDLVMPGQPGAVVDVGDSLAPATDRFGDQAAAISILHNDETVDDEFAYVKIPGVTSLTPPVTMTVWINQQAGNGTGLVMGLDQGPQLYQSSDAISMRVPSSVNNYDSVGSVALTDGQWVLVAGVFTQAGGAWQLTLYVNDAPTPGAPTVAGVASKGNLNIGGLYPRDGCSDGEQVCNSGFVGYLNDARIYDRALSAQEIKGLHDFVPKP